MAGEADGPDVNRPDTAADRPATAADRPEAAAAGNALVWFTGSLLLFGLFLVVVPGTQPDGRTWLWVGVVLAVLGGVTSALATSARLRYLRSSRGPADPQ
jgi:hypothetical protein